MALSMQLVTSSTIDYNNNGFLFDCTSGSFTITLPDASVGNGINYQMKRIDNSANTVTLQGYTSSQKIDNTVTRLVRFSDAFLLVSYGSNWYRM